MKRISFLRLGVVMAIAAGALLLAGCTTGNNPPPGTAQTPVSSPTQPLGEATPAVGAVGSGGGTPTSTSTASLTLPSSTITQTSDLQFSGSGFGPGETVIISASKDANGPTTEIGRVTTDENGAFGDTTIHPPDWLTSGAHVLSAVGEVSHRQFNTVLYVRAQQPFIEIGNFAVKPLDKLGFVAGGFLPNEQVKVFLEDHPQDPLLTTTADAAGNLPWTEVTMPVVDGSSHNLILLGQTSGIQVLRQISIMAFTPQFDLDPYAGLPGTQATLYGKGFFPGETINVYVGGSQQPAFTITADDGGGFAKAGTIVIPTNTRSQSLDVTLVGQSSGAKVSRSFTVVTPYPYGGLSAFSGAPGTSILLSGLGFAIGEKVNIYLGNRSGTLVATAQADGEGKFQNAGPVQVPADATSDVTYTFVGADSGVESSAVFKVIILPTIGANPSGPK